MKKIKTTRKNLIKAFKLWGEDFKNNPDSYETEGVGLTSKRAEKDADFLIFLLGKQKYKM